MVTAIEPAQAPLDATEILELLPHGIVVVGADWRVRYANPEGRRMIGENGATLWERCPDLDQTAFSSAFRYAMTDRTELLTESALPHIGWCQSRARPLPDGGLLIVLKTIQPHTMDAGQAKQALLVGEIGDALTREDTLHDALQRCAAAMVRHLDATLARVWTMEPTGEHLEMCASAGLDKSIDSELGRIHVGEHKVGMIADTLEPYLTNDVATDPTIGFRPWMQRERIISFAGYPLRVEDRVVGVMAMYSRRALDHDMLNALSTIADTLALGIARKTSDIGRRRAERMLRAQNERLELLHELGKQLVAELDVQALVQKVIDTATHLAGAQVGAFFYHLQGENNETLTYYALAGHGRDGFATLPLPRTTPLLSHTFLSEEVVRIDDVRTHASFGKLGPYFGMPKGHAPVTSYLAVPVRSRDRRIGVLLFGHAEAGVFTEETERVIIGIASTAAIAVDNARLFKEARDLITALEKTNRELDQFAYVASHDLKAPLRGIANLAQWIEDDLGDQMDEQAREHMHLLRGRVLRLENLIGGILAYSRAGRDRGSVGTVDVAQLVAEVWELLAPPAQVTLVTSPLPRLITSRVQLQQVLMNLIANAIKYNADRDLTIDVSATRDGDKWVFSVADDGVGIAPEFHDKIWGLFQTLERRDVVESTGIGLSVVRKIVEAHRGRAWVESKLGAGAKFLFTWPVDSQGDKLHG